MKKHLFLAMAMLFSWQTNASHILCQSITLQYAGSPNTYVLKGYMYRDCAGIPSPTSLMVFYSDSVGTGNALYWTSLPIVNQQIMPVFTCAPTVPFLCTNGFGIEITEFADTIVLPNASANWKFWISECCRSAAISTINNPTGAGAFCEATLDNLNYPTNSLPDFSTLNVPIFCLNQPAVYPNTAIEPDGDSIVYSLIGARDNQTQSIYNPFNISYVGPYSPTQFISTNAPVFFDVTTGVSSFTPVLLQQGVMVVLASEYRNGVLIGTSMRDINVMIVDGINNPSIVTGTVYVDANNNGNKDVTEYGVANAFVQSNPFYAYNITDPTGLYTMYIGTGPHTVDLANIPAWFTVNPASYSFNFTAAGNISNANDFALVPVPGTTEMEITLNAAPVRPTIRTLVNINVKNNGSDNAGGVVTFIMPDSVAVDSTSITPASVSGNTLTWTLPTLYPLQDYDIIVYVKADSGLVIGDSVYFQAGLAVTPGTDIDISNNTADGWARVINSFDPNIKSAFPSGTIPQSSVIAGEPITYRIDFENTGTANALTVRITDILPAELLLNTVQVLASSHQYSTRIFYPRELEFSFNNINLTPNSIDPVNSKGYIILRAAPDPNLPVGTVISNEAKIYFDNNLPIITPVAEVIIGNTTTGIAELLSTAGPSLNISPNPAKDIINISLPSAAAGNFEVQVYTLQGRVIKKETIQNAEQGAIKMDVSNLAPGAYMIIVQNEQNAWSGRLVR